MKEEKAEEALDLTDVSKAAKELINEVSNVIVGKKQVIEMLLTALLCEGHALLEGPPGVAKTLLAKTFASALGGTFIRIQMTPDLLPSDIIGVNVYNPRKGDFTLKKGPIFANVVMADELNRASPKAQAALLEAMQERQVTIEGVTLPLERPFIVLATQVPYGAAGTYPLTEVQIDRFAFKLDVDYPSSSEEIEIISRIDEIEKAKVKQVLTIEKAIKLIELAKEIHVSSKVKSYIAELINGLRNREGIKLGPSPRGSIWIFKAARVKAMLEGRDYVIPDDVKAVAPYVLSHRIVLEPEVEAEGVSAKELIQEALSKTPVPKL